MSIVKYVETAKNFFAKELGVGCRVISVIKEEKNVRVMCEIIVDPEYTARKGLGDIVEIYHVFFDEKFELTGYELRETKRRASLESDTDR